MNEPFYSFNSYLKERFGQRVHRVSLDAEFDCPNLDATFSDKGCIFCDNRGFALYAGSKIKLEQQIKASIDYYRQKLGVSKFIAYFQAFSNTYADLSVLKSRYDVIRKFPEIVGLSISTRPDCINEEKIKLISAYQRDYLVWIEYGLQTTDERLLKLLNRNHTYLDFIKALEMARSYNINVGVHMMFGLPDASKNVIKNDARALSKLDIQGIKFHALHVFKDTALAKLYQSRMFVPIEKDDYVSSLCDFLERIPGSWVVLRLCSSASKERLIAPLWINDRHGVISAVTDELRRRGSYQGFRYEKNLS